jgi:hypothetical protein
MSWTQAVCDGCWSRLEVGPPRNLIREEYRDDETCCLCGQATRSGLYARLDPAKVPYPRL